MFLYSICGHSITPYYAHKMYNATKKAITVLCEGLRHELIFVNSKIKVSVSLKDSNNSNNKKKNHVCFEK